MKNKRLSAIVAALLLGWGQGWAQTVCPTSITFTSPAGAQVCENTSVTFGVNGSGHSGYTWSGGGATTSTTTVNYLSAQIPISVTVNNTTCAGGSIVLTSNPVVTPAPVVSWGVPVGTTLCEGNTRIPTVNCASCNFYTWSHGGAGVGLVNLLPATTTTNVSATLTAQAPSVGTTSNATITVAVSATGTNGCPSNVLVSAPVSVLEVTQVTAISSTGVSVCHGTAITLTPQFSNTGCAGCNIIGYTWNGSAPTMGPNNASAFEITANNTSGAPITPSYTLTVTNSNGCAATASRAITFNPNPTFTLAVAPAISVCEGTPFTLTAPNTAGVTYSWSNATTTTPTHIAATSALAPGSHSVQATAVDANNCSATDNIALSVNHNPVINVTASVNPLCSSRSTTIGAACTGFGCSATGSPYNWSGAATGWSSGTATSVVSPGVGLPVYSVVFTNSAGCTATASRQVSVNATPAVTMPASVSVCSGTTVNINPTFTLPTTNDSYIWSSGQTSSSIAVVPSVGTTTYSVSVDRTFPINGGVCTATGNTTVTVHPNPAFILAAGSGCTSQTLTYTSSAPGSGQAPFNYTWAQNGTVLPGMPTANNFVTLTSVAQTVVPHSLTVTDSRNCTASSSANFTIFQCGTESIQRNKSTGYCRGEAITLTVVGASPSAQYEWQPGGQTSPSIVIIPTAADSIFVTRRVTIKLDDGNQVINLGPLVDTIYFNNPQPVLSAPDSICFGNSAAITVSNCATCSYGWGAQPVTGVAPVYTASPTVTQNYVVTATDGDGCTATATRTINVKPRPVVDILPSGDTARYCPESSVALDANPSICNGCTYQWSNGATSRIIGVNTDATFSVTVNQNGCTGSDNIVVAKRNSPEPRIAIDSAGTTLIGYYPPPILTVPYMVLCNGVPDTLYATNCPGCNFLWSTGNTSQSILATAGNTMYYVEGIDTFGCRGLSNPAIAINSTDGNNSVATATPNIVCNGDSVTLSVTPCIGCSYQWYRNIAAGTDTVVATTRIAKVANGGVFYARVVNANGCVFFSNSVTVTTLATVKPPISTTNDSICMGGTFTVSTPYNSSYQYQWYYNDTIISSGTNHSLTVNSGTMFLGSPTFPFGKYNVDVTFPNGCKVRSDSVIIGLVTFVAPISPSFDTICLNDSVHIFTQLVPGYQYQWYRNGLPIAGAVAASYYAKLPGDYYVRVTNQHGCQVNTPISRMFSTTLSSVSLTVNDASICPGDIAEIRSSISIGSTYQWYRNNLTVPPVAPDTIHSNVYRATLAGSYFVVVSNSGCQLSSDTLTITVEGVPFPALNSTAGRVCNGVTPVLTTPNCTGCVYTWLRDTMPIAGAISDSVYTVSSTTQIGSYSVSVLYPNGCRDTSNFIDIIDGTFVAAISGSSPFICNGAPISLSATATPVTACTGGCLYQWFFDNVPQALTVAPSYNASDTVSGSYTVRITNNFGCFETSPFPWTTTAINLDPIITTNSTAICGSQPAVLTLTNPCVGCTYQWYRGYTTLIVGATSPTFSTTTAGIYTVEVTQSTCSRMSNPITLNLLPPLAIPITATNTSICNGESVTLSRVGGSCVGCIFQWLRNGSAIPGATLHTYTTTLPGDYRLVMIQTGNNCADTSAILTIQQIGAEPGFSLNFATISPVPYTMAAPYVDLDQGLFPALLRGGIRNGRYSNLPLIPNGDSTLFNDAIPPNQFNIFNPSVAGSGFHQITYRYDSAGCTFTAIAIMQVLPAPQVFIRNTRPIAPQYEACVSDTLIIEVSNFAFPVTSVEVFNLNDVYTPFPGALISPTPTVYGSTTIYNDTIVVVVPEWAKESYLRLTGPGPADTFYTPYVLIHNKDLTFAGLPATLCSNGSPLSLVVNPSGGYLTAQYPDNSFVGGGAMSGTTITPALFDPSKYTSDSMNIRVIYNYPYTYTNGAPCPIIDTFSRMTTARSVFLNSVEFNKISVSQTQELLPNLVYGVNPYQSSPSRWQHGFRFSGSFTNPVGNPVHYLPSNAGVGPRNLTYIIDNGPCTNSTNGTIIITPAPVPLAMADTICRTNAPITFTRDALYAYAAPVPTFVAPGIEYRDTFNILVVTSVNNNEGIDTLNPNLGLEVFRYNPAAVTGNFDTIRITYGFKRVEYQFGVPYDTVEYIIGSIYKPIYIEDTVPVQIIDTIVNPVYCEVNINYLMAGDPFGGYFQLQGGTGAYAGNDTLDFGILNPFVVHGNESTDVTYLLRYIYPGLVCRSVDTMSILIPEPLNPAFATLSGRRTYCDEEPADPIVVVTPTGSPVGMPPVVGTFLIGGVAQGALQFDPVALDPGLYVVQYQVSDGWNCLQRASDTFEIYPLPDVYFTPTLAPSYCTNDSSFFFQVHPAPICSQSSGTGIIKLDDSFEGAFFPPSGWGHFNLNPSGSNWELASGALLSNTGIQNAFVNVSSNAQNTWLITPPIAMTVGNMYRIQYYIRAGAQNCPTCPDASLKVSVVQGTSVLAHQNFGTVLLNAPSLTNEFYIPVSHDFVCPTSGTYTFAFHNNSPAGLARSLRLDDVRVTEISASNCIDGGIGSLFAPGTVYQGDSTYLFTPTSLSPGNIVFRYLFINNKGCLDSAIAPITIHQHVTPTIVGLDPTYCVNSPTDTLSAIPNNGIFPSGFTTLPLGANPTTPNLGQIPKPHYDPNTPTPGEIVRYRYVDPNTGCIDYDWDTVVVLDMPDTLIFDNLPTDFCAADPPMVLTTITLIGTPQPGIFYAPGVINGAGGPGVAQFSPTLAVAQMGHTGDTVMTYIYPLLNGCVDTLRQNITIHANPDLTFTNMPDSICLNADPRLIVVNNREVSGSMGNIVQNILLPPTATLPPPTFGSFTGALMTPGDSLVPQLVPAGTYLVTYSYTDINNCTSVITRNVRVDTVPVVYFTFTPDSPDSIFCELNDPGTLLLAYPPYYPGSGYLSFGTDTFQRSFYQIDPLALATYPTNALYPIFYSYTDLLGCTGTGTDSIEVRPYPRIDMTALPTAFCDSDTTLYVDLMQYVTPVGGVFSDNLPITSIVPPSFLDLDAPAGNRNITYFYLDTVTGCYNSETVAVSVYNTPTLDFDIFGGCVGEDIIFRGYAIDITPGLDTITNIVWSFGDGNSYNYVPTNPVAIDDTTYVYSNHNIYTVQLQVTNQGLCTSVLGKQLIVSPTVNTYPYFQDFEAGHGGWYADQPLGSLTQNIWTRNNLTGAHINDPGNTAWKTRNLPPNIYQPQDNGWVLSPCFDMRPLIRPMVSMDVWRDMNLGIDGTIMEFFDPYTLQWQRVGNPNRGINWYTSEAILSRPGNQDSVALPRGWTGVGQGWESARYRLDDLLYRNFVRFRIAFSAFNTPNLNAYEGMAFDNVWVGDRTRNVLVEHFSNENYMDVDEVDPYVYNLIFNQDYGRDVVLVQYQTIISGSDVHNTENPVDPSARVLLYGISDDNQVVVDGLPPVSSPGVSDELTEYDLDFEMLQFPAFLIDITQFDVNGGVVNTAATVRAVKVMPEDDYAVHTIVIEDSMMSNAGHQLIAVARRMMPRAAGERFYRSWNINDAVSVSNTWEPGVDYGTFYDGSNLNLVVLIQNMSTEEVFQVASTRDISIYFPPDTINVGTEQPVVFQPEDYEITSVKVYPNPAVDYFTVEFEQPLEGQYDWRLVDALGRSIERGVVAPGTKNFVVDTYKLPSGPYFFLINDKRVLTQRQVIIRRP